MITPPTDSLYKFIAIAGVVMILWGSAFPWNKAYELKLQAVDLDGKIHSVSQKAEQLKLQYAKLNSERKALDPKSEDFEVKKAAIKSEKMSLYIQMLEAQHPTDIDEKKLKVMHEAQVVYDRIGWASLIFGIVFVIFGFAAWYIKIQRHLDIEVSSPK
jgi:hypothetical protein